MRPTIVRYQKQNMQVRALQLRNREQLLNISKKAIALAIKLESYIGRQLPLSEQQRQNKYKNYDLDEVALNENTVKLPYSIITKWIGASTTTKETNRKCRKTLDELIAIGYLHPLNNTKDEYLVNPLFFYQGRTFADMYELWCEAKETNPIDALLEGSKQVKDYSSNRSYSTQEWQEFVELGMVNPI